MVGVVEANDRLSRVLAAVGGGVSGGGVAAAVPGLRPDEPGAVVTDVAMMLATLVLVASGLLLWGEE
jgi:hypothetical protein